MLSFLLELLSLMQLEQYQLVLVESTITLLVLCMTYILTIYALPIYNKFKKKVNRNQEFCTASFLWAVHHILAQRANES
jgi:hypothetical protein